MGHKSGFLSGPEPEEIEEKTAAELDDAKRPAAMAVSSSMFDLAETDDRPAIEQRVAKGALFDQDTKSEQQAAKARQGGERHLKVDAAFAAEMHAREAKEHEERERRHKAEEAATSVAKENREAAAKQELTTTRTLDPEEEHDKLQLEQQTDNEQKLYPDPIKRYTDADDEILKRDLQKGKLPGRARLAEKFDEKLHRSIMVSFVCSAAAAVLYFMFYATEHNRNFPGFMRTISLVVAIGFLAYATFTLYTAGKRCHDHTIPYDQRSMYILAMLGPGILFRLGTAAVLTTFMGLFGAAGGMLATFAGILLGASAHYTMLATFNVPFGQELPFINAAAIAIINTVIPVLAVQLSAPTSSFQDLPTLAMQLGGMLLSIGLIFLCELFAYKVSRPPKESI